jgi:hypothetical protein
MSEPEAPSPKPQPYGNGPLLLGISAYDFLYDLSYDVPTTWPENRRWQWLKSDGRAYNTWHSLQEHVPSALAEPDLNADQIELITGLVTNVNVAVPYDEAERSWLYGAYIDAYNEAGAGSIGIIRQRQPEEIVSRGLRQVIDGRDLMRRWWAWRRETDEFSGQGSLDIARGALRSLIETVAPSDLPAADTALQRASATKP